LGKIFNRFQDEKLLFVYFSDHGEVITEQKHGHNFTPPCKSEYEIPFVIFSSISNKRLIELQALNQENKINLESLPQIIKYVIGVDNNISKISTKNHVIAMEPKGRYELEQKDYNKIEYCK